MRDHDLCPPECLEKQVEVQADDQGAGRVATEEDNYQRWYDGDQAAQPNRNMPSQKSLHHDLPCHGADRGGGKTGGQQRDGEYPSGGRAKQRLQGQVGFFDRGDMA